MSPPYPMSGYYFALLFLKENYSERDKRKVFIGGSTPGILNLGLKLKSFANIVLPSSHKFFYFSNNLVYKGSHWQMSALQLWRQFRWIDIVIPKHIPCQHIHILMFAELLRISDSLMGLFNKLHRQGIEVLHLDGDGNFLDSADMTYFTQGIPYSWPAPRPRTPTG